MSKLVTTTLFVLGAAACGTNTTGNLEAKTAGDVSRPIDRASPTAAITSACGTGAKTTAGAVIQRRPYLQQVTAGSAWIGWVSTGGGAERVEITTPDGASVQTAPGTVELYAMRTAGERQIWAQLDHLAADTIYCYRITDGTQTLFERTGFRTAPAADSTARVRVLAFGDSGGGGSDQLALAEWMHQFPYDLIVHTGDVAYDDGTIGQYEDNVFGVYADLFEHLPFFPAAGNHDYYTLNGAPFRDVFALPGTTGEKWYSYDWGPVHFVALDTESDYRTQMEWLDADLAATTRAWKVIYLHRPPYSSGYHGSDTALRDSLAPVTARHGVQLVLAGHDHHYERMAPQGGVAHILTGGGGKGTRAVDGASFTAYAAEVIHFVILDIGPDELVVHAIDATGKMFDSMAIPRT